MANPLNTGMLFLVYHWEVYLVFIYHIVCVCACTAYKDIYIFQEYEEPVYSYSTYPDRRFSSRYPNILKMSPPFASSEGVSASGDRYQSDGV